MHGAGGWVDAEGTACLTSAPLPLYPSAPPPLLYTPLLAPGILPLCLQPKLKHKLKLKLYLKLKLKVYLRPPPAICQAPPTSLLPLALGQAEPYTLYINVILTIGCVLDVLTQLQIHCAPCHRLKPAHRPHFPPYCPLPLPLPSDLFRLENLLILSIQFCQITAIIGSILRRCGISMRASISFCIRSTTFLIETWLQ
jgi:hypothetical protein